MNPSAIWPSPLSVFAALSSLYLALSSQPSTTERARASEGFHGTAAGPLTGVRAPQRVSTPPSSGLAAAPLWPESGEQLPPGSAFFSPRAVLHDGQVIPLGFPLPLFPFFGSCLLFSVLTDWDGLGFNYVRVRVSGWHCLSSPEGLYGFRVRHRVLSPPCLSFTQLGFGLG